MKRFLQCTITAAWLGCGAAASALPTPIATLTLGDATAGIGVDPVLRRAYVTNYASGTVSVIDLDANTVVATVDAGVQPRRLTVNAATHRVYWVNDTAPGGVGVLDGTTNTVLTRVTTGNASRTIAADFQKGQVYAGNRDSNSVTVIDTATNTVVRTLAVGRNPGGIDVNRLLGRLYVASGPDSTVTVIDQATGATTTVPVGSNPGFARVDARTGKVYVNNIDDKTVSVIGPGNTVLKTIPIGAGTTSNIAAVSAVYRRLYIANALDDTLTIIDTDTDTVVHTVAMGKSPQHVNVDNAGGNIYVVNQADKSVTILDARTETVIGTIAVGGGPWITVDVFGHLLTLNQNGTALDSMTVTTTEDTLAGTDIAVEWYHAAFDHYFHSANGTENRLLADGVFGEAWDRTLLFWRVWTEAAPGRLVVCRFFSPTFAPRSSHFFTPYAPECESLKTGGVWTYEDTVYFLALPGADGTCASGTEPLYRLYNDGQGGAPNHRYTADLAVRDAMIVRGWTPEGSGPQAVFACTPPLRG